MTAMFASHAGIVYSLLYGIGMTVEYGCAKFVLRCTSASFLTLARCAAIVCLTPFIEWESASTLDTCDLCLYIACSVIGILPYAFNVSSLNYIGIGDSSAVLFGSNIFLVSIIGHFALDEKLSFYDVIVLSFDVIGVVLVTRLTVIFAKEETQALHYQEREFGVIMLLLAAICLSVWPVLVRKLQQRNSLYFVLLSSLHGFFGMFLAGIWTTFESDWLLPNNWEAILVGIGYIVFSVGQFICAIKVIETGDIKSVGLSMALSLALSYIAQILLFGESVDWISTIGAGLVLICVIGITCLRLVTSLST